MLQQTVVAGNTCLVVLNDSGHSRKLLGRKTLNLARISNLFRNLELNPQLIHLLAGLRDFLLVASQLIGQSCPSQITAPRTVLVAVSAVDISDLVRDSGGQFTVFVEGRDFDDGRVTKLSDVDLTRQHLVSILDRQFTRLLVALGVNAGQFQTLDDLVEDLRRANDLKLGLEKVLVEGRRHRTATHH